MSQLTRLILTALILAGLTVLVGLVLKTFLVPLAWAAILGYATWPAYEWLRLRCGNRRSLAALLMTLILGSLMVIPMVWGTWVLRQEMAEFLRGLPGWLAQKPRLPAFLRDIPYLGSELSLFIGRFDDLNALVQSEALPWLQSLSNDLLSVAGGVGRNLTKFALTALTLFFVYRDGGEWVRQAMLVLSEVLGPRAGRYLQTVETTVKAVVYGIVLTAVGQGVVAGLGYWAVGTTAPIILSLLTMAIALVPFGTPFAWGSVSVWLLIQGHQWAAGALLLWGVLVVSWVDNVIRPLVISATTQIPFLLVLFGVLGGLVNFGFIGLFLGPVTLAIALAAWREWLLSIADRRAAPAQD